MNERTSDLSRKFQAKLAIILYESQNDDDARGKEKYYLESHPIDRFGKILAGQPLKQETIQGMVDVFFDERKSSSLISGLIPENVLKYEVLPGGKYDLVWYRPSESRTMFFAENLNIPSGKCWVPAMVYRVINKELRIYGLSSSWRPDENAILHQAPYHNVSGGGTVCLGNAKVRKPVTNTYSNITKYWEDLFWLSEFTHLNVSENPAKTNINTLWREMIKTGAIWPIMGELIPTKLTIKNLL